MRRILIVGAGQSGLQLALGLQTHGYEVTVVSARTPDEVREGRVMSTQCLFGTALAHERDLGLDFWEQRAPRIEGVGVSVSGPDATRAVDWVGRLEAAAQSVDQRVKLAGWMEVFADRGGKLVIATPSAERLDNDAPVHDLTIVAAGRSELVSLFPPDPVRSIHRVPQRALSVCYVNGLQPRPEHPDFHAVRCNLVPGIGELFVMPTHTTTGGADILFWEAVPGGPADIFAGIGDPREHLRRTLDLMRRYTPWEYERARRVELTDPGGTLSGRLVPTVREPVAELPCGVPVLGMADTVVVNDPITGQGANNAAKSAAAHLDAIIAHGDAVFDRKWMRAAHDAVRPIVEPATKWSNAMLAPPPEHVREILDAAAVHQEVADRFACAFDRPADLEDWFFDPDKARRYLGALA
ncbi:styrene monooxygenase/indole monooxygenase family protein [Streptomyces sp. NPDC047097]|uniref:styrene monooxygenase/indole monooxygenase family protein n=1 Tax=Streptomyces sp. NPDC047097 TaxID=3155260 RepID=UPI0033FEBD71